MWKMKSPDQNRSGLFVDEAIVNFDQRLTWNVRVVECVTLPPVPVIVIGYVPVGALLATLSVKSDEPEPVTDAGLKLDVTPDGTPVAESATTESKPPEAVMVTIPYPL